MEATVITGNAIEAFRLRVLYRGLKLEIKTKMTMTRGRTSYAIIKSMGFRGSREKVLAQFGLLLAVDAWFTGIEFQP